MFSYLSTDEVFDRSLICIIKSWISLFFKIKTHNNIMIFIIRKGSTSWTPDAKYWNDFYPSFVEEEMEKGKLQVQGELVFSSKVW